MSLNGRQAGELRMQAWALAEKLELKGNGAHVRDLIERQEYLEATLVCRQAFMRERQRRPAPKVEMGRERLEDLRLLLDTLQAIRTHADQL